MNRQEKQEVVKDLKDHFSKSVGSFVINYRGLSVADLQKLRRNLKEQGAQMHVAKARLMRLAAKNFEEYEGLDKHFKDQIALVFADEQPSAVAKVLYETAKATTKLTIIAGCVEGRYFDEEGLRFVSTLPSKDVLLAQLAAVLSAPSTQLARALNNLFVKLVLTLKAIEQKKQS